MMIRVWSPYSSDFTGLVCTVDMFIQNIPPPFYVLVTMVSLISHPQTFSFLFKIIFI